MMFELVKKIKNNEITEIDLSQYQAAEYDAHQQTHVIADVDSITSLAVSPNNQYFASASSRHENIKIWNVPTKEIFKTLAGTERRTYIRKIVFLDDTRLASITNSFGNNNVVTVWNCLTGEKAKTLQEEQDDIFDICALSANILVSISQNAIQIWDVENNKIMRKFPIPSAAKRKLITRIDEAQFATADPNGTIRFWHIHRDECIKLVDPIGDDHITAMNYLTSTVIAVGYRSGYIRILDFQLGQFVQTLHAHTDWILSFALFQDGQLASACRDNDIRIWDLATGKCTQLQGHTNRVNTLCVLPDQSLMSGAGSIVVWAPTDTTLRRWEFPKRTAKVEDFAAIFWVLEDNHSVTSLVLDNCILREEDVRNYLIPLLRKNNVIQRISLKNTQITNLGVRMLLFFLSDTAKKIDIVLENNNIDMQLINELRDITKNSASNVYRYSSNNLICEDVLDFSHVYIQDFSKGKDILEEDSAVAESCFVSAAFKNEQVVVPYNGSHEICIYDIRSGKKIYFNKKSDLHNGVILCVAIISETSFVTGSTDGTLKIWDINATACTTHIQEGEVISLLALSAQRLLIGLRNGCVKILNLIDGQHKVILQNNENFVMAMEKFCHQETNEIFIILGMLSGEIKIISENTLLPILSIQAHGGSITKIIFWKDEHFISASVDVEIKLWKLELRPIVSCTQIHTFLGHMKAVASLSLLPHSQLASGGSDKKVFIWDLEKRELLHILPEEHELPIASVFYFPSGRFASVQRPDGFISTVNSVAKIKVWNCYMRPLDCNMEIGPYLNGLNASTPVKSINLNHIPVEYKVSEDYDFLSSLRKAIQKIKSLESLSIRNANMTKGHLQELLKQVTLTSVSLKSIDISGNIAEKDDNFITDLKQKLSLSKVATEQENAASAIQTDQTIDASPIRSQRIVLAKDIVTIRVWFSNVGHASLQTHGDEGIYVSFYPVESKWYFGNRKSKKAVHRTLADDMRHEEPDVTINLYSLDVDAINQCFKSFKALDYNWSLWAGSFWGNVDRIHCSGIVYYLLRKGGLNNLIVEENPWDLQHDSVGGYVHILAVAAQTGISAAQLILTLTGRNTNAIQTLASVYERLDILTERTLERVIIAVSLGINSLSYRLFNITPKDIAEITQKCKVEEARRYDIIVSVAATVPEERRPGKKCSIM